MEIDKIIPPEIKDDVFYKLIQKLASEENIKTVLEIGSSSGNGSTEAFVNGLKQNPNSPQLFCIELSNPRYSTLKQRYADTPFVKCYNVSSVDISSFLNEHQVRTFYQTTPTNLNNYPMDDVLNWLNQDKNYIKSTDVPQNGIRLIKQDNHIDSFDMVLIDGSAFTGVAELNEVYGSRIILLDDINDIKNHENYKRLVADTDYILMDENHLIRNGYAVFKRKEEVVPIHFFTLVLNGLPFIRHHIEVFKHLPFQWHWHIVEGVADQKHDTAWSISNGGHISEEMHVDGRSIDGTSEYLDELSQLYPENVILYRKSPGFFWDGKIEMINAPLENIHEQCLLWQVDADELWTIEQICAAHNLFTKNPDTTAAFYRCNFFVGENLVTITQNTYGDHEDYEWIRTWRFSPGNRWFSHEPPVLCRQETNSQWRDLARLQPLRHNTTSSIGLVFDHYAYATEKQVKFKESYYGYSNAVEHWKKLQDAKQYPVKLCDYFPWVHDETLVDEINHKDILPLAQRTDNSTWNFEPHGLRFSKRHNYPKRLLWTRTDAIGDNVLAATELEHLKKHYDGAEIIVLCQDRVADIYSVCPFVDHLITFDRIKALSDETYRKYVLDQVIAFKPDISLNSVYSREPLTDYFAIECGAKEKIAIDCNLSNISSELREKHNRFYSRIIPSIGEHKSEIERHSDFLRGLGIDNPILDINLWATQEDEQYALELFREYDMTPERTIVLFAGAHGAHKLSDAYGEAIDEVCKDGNYTVVALGAAQDAEIISRNLRKLHAPSVNLCGQTSLRQSAAILAQCRLGIGADTGLAHICCGVGTPNVILLGGAHFGRFMPYSSLTSVACLPLDCYGCDWQCRCGIAHCVQGVSPSVLKEALRQTLARKSDRPRVFIQPKSMWTRSENGPQWRMLNQSDIPVNCEIIVVENTERESEQNSLKTDFNPIRVSAIVSTYKSERFMRGCLEDLVNQTLYKKGGLEIIVIDACSPENEGAIVQEFQSKHENIRYIRTDERVPLYQAWNIGIQNARGEYISNANTDDRHAPEMLERLVNELDGHPDIGLVYADCLISKTENATFEAPHAVGIFTWKEHNHAELLKACYIGPQPVWRRSLHDTYGYFDEDYISAGDYEFWLRLSANGVGFRHIPQTLGLYLENPTSLSVGNAPLSLKETTRARGRYSSDTPKSQSHTLSASDDFNTRKQITFELIRKQKWTEAVEWARECLSEHPDDWELKNAFSIALLNTGDREGAKALMREGTENAPDKHNFSHNLAATLLEEGDTMNALEYVLQAVSS